MIMIMIIIVIIPDLLFSHFTLSRGLLSACYNETASQYTRHNLISLYHHFVQLQLLLRAPLSFLLKTYIPFPPS